MNAQSIVELFEKATQTLTQEQDSLTPDKQLAQFLSVHTQTLTILPTAFSLLKTSFDQREHFWETGGRYFEACQHFLGTFRTREMQQEGSDKNLLLSKLTMEWLNIQQWIMCWGASNSFMPSQQFWQSLCQFYRDNKKAPYCELSTSPLTGLLNNSTPRNEFHCLLILSVSALDSFPSNDIIYALRLAKLLSPHLLMSHTYEDRHRFGVNVDAPSMPSIIRNQEPKDRNLFFTIPNFSARFEKAIERLGHYTDIPQASQKRVQHIINQQWGMKKENRRMYERKKVDFTMHIAIGYEAVLKVIPLERSTKNLKQLVDHATLTHHQVSSAETEDMSMGGFGINIPDFQKTPIVIGSLVSLDIPNAGSWRLGIIRRIRRTDKQKAFIGIQLISSEASVAPITEQGKQIAMAVILPDLKQKEAVGIILPASCSNYSDLRINSLTENSSYTYQPTDDVWMSGPMYQLVGAQPTEQDAEEDNAIHDWFSEK